jgi:fumarate reductase flavoprotein subunit
VVTGKRNHFSAGTILYKSIPRVMHTIDGRGAELMRVLAKECRERGIEVPTNTRSKKIICGENGQVTGVLATDPDKEFNITTKSVIITTGGYACNKEMLMKIVPITILMS